MSVLLVIFLCTSHGFQSIQETEQHILIRETISICLGEWRLSCFGSEILSDNNSNWTLFATRIGIHTHQHMLYQFSFIILPKRVCNPQIENLWYWHFLPPKLYHMTTIKINKPEINKSNTHDCPVCFTLAQLTRPIFV